MDVLAEVDWGHMDDGWGVAMLIGMLLFWGVLIVLIVWLLTARPGHLGSGGHKLTPLEILERRYAEGAISTEEYRERRDALQGPD